MVKCTKPFTFKFLVMIFLLGLSPSLSAYEEISENIECGSLFYFKTDQDRIDEEYYSLGSKLKFQMKPMKYWKMKLEIDAGTDAVRVDEIYARYKKGKNKIKLGTFENSLLVDDFFNSREYPFASDGYVRNRLDDMGWYSSNSLGVQHFQMISGQKGDWGHVGELVYSANSSEMKITVGMGYSQGGDDSVMGVIFSYYPHFIHDLWGDSSFSLSSSAHDNGYYEDHYFLINAFIGDMTETRKLIYKIEYTTGNNLNDPVGYIQYPGDGGISWFFASDFFAAYIMDKGDVQWTPAVNLSYYIHDLSVAESNTVTVRLGNRLNWDDTAYLHFDLGVEIDSYYEGDSSSDLITCLGALCGISLQFTI